MDKGVIYMLTCKTSGKKYVGQALNFTGSNNAKWGMEGRWKSHVKEALGSGKDHCRLLNNAIRKYGENDFEREVLCECLIEEMDAMEEKYMEEHKTLDKAHGYNLKSGGSRGKWSEETKKAKSEAMKGFVHTDEAKKKMSVNQIGNRRGAKTRKYPEDNALPKYILACRKDDKVFGYAVSHYPIGVDKKEYISKTFCNTKDPSEALEQAKEYLEELKTEYEVKVSNAVQERAQQDAINKVVQITMSKTTDDFIFAIPHPENPNKIKGYRVKGLTDDKGNPIPEKKFDDVNNYHSLNRAKKYVKQVQMLLENKATVEDWSKIDTIYKCDKKGVETEVLPKYINVCSYKGEKSGYVVNGYPLGNGKKSCKKFTNTRFNTMEDLYKMALEYLEELKKTHPL